ncbi:hypothetical protein [Alistipes sp.]|uniref:hypothetical protein n=1 Tax=Alistipes sp. TaxID=1872444 RepID=UPI003AB48B5B
MKKIFLLAFAMASLGVFSAYAQQPSVRYQGEADAGYAVGVGTFSSGRANLHLINGVGVGRFFSAGIGLGVDYWHELSDNGELSMPVFLNLKGYLPVSEKVRPFLSLDLGVSVGLTEGLSEMSGLLCTPAIGVAVGVGNSGNALIFSIGYNMQQWSESGFGINTNALNIKLGFQF